MSLFISSSSIMRIVVTGFNRQRYAVKQLQSVQSRTHYRLATGGHSPHRNCRIEANTVAGSSVHDACAAPSIVTSRALGSEAAHSRPLPYGALRSFVPWMIRTGIVIFFI